MSWSKPNVSNIAKPPAKLHWRTWGMFITLLFFITSFILARLWPDSSYSSQWTYWVGSTLITLIIGGIAFSIRIYFYGLAQEEYNIWQQEQKNIEQNWQKWAMQSLVVLDSFYVLPNQVTANKILNNGSNISAEVNKSLTFNDKFDTAHYIEDLFVSMRSVLNKLPKTESINITVYSSQHADICIENTISQAYQKIGIKQRYSLSQKIENEIDVEQLTKWVDATEPELELIIVDNTKSQSSSFLTAFLLVKKSHYQDMGIDIAQVEILRPMFTSDLQLAFQQMVDMQPVIKQVNQLWLANLTNKQEKEVLINLSKNHIELEDVNKLQRIGGNQDELSYWLALALGCESVIASHKNNLITSITQNQWLSSVIAVL